MPRQRGTSAWPPPSSIGLCVSGPVFPFACCRAGTALDAVGRIDWAPLGGAAGDAEAARNRGMAATIFHWALHPWAIYAVGALALAFFSFNYNRPLTLRSAFYPLFGEAVWGWIGHVIDTLAVFATLFGLATSLGFGTEQALAGLNYLFGTPTGNGARVLLIALITAARSEEHTSELQSLMRISYAVFCLKKQKHT